MFKTLVEATKNSNDIWKIYQSCGKTLKNMEKIVKKGENCPPTLAEYLQVKKVMSTSRRIMTLLPDIWDCNAIDLTKIRGFVSEE